MPAPKKPLSDIKVRRPTTAEELRLVEDQERKKNWKRWGPYLSERQWGTVREDYSEDSNNWTYFTHEDAPLRAYRWGEDGILGFTDRECRLCFALALWNGKDAILKERLFGLTGPEGNHGEDVKELYYYLDSSPTHSYFKGLYKYPQAAFPYHQLRTENKNRGLNDPEFEILDTGIFNESRYFDIFAEYAKGSPNDILIKITAVNRGPETASLTLLPTLWFRNTWSWGCHHEGCLQKPPSISLKDPHLLELKHPTLQTFFFHASPAPGNKAPEFLFTHNETNHKALWGTKNSTPFVKDAFHRYIIHQQQNAINPKGEGTKAGILYSLTLKAGQSQTVTMRLFSKEEAPRGKPLGPTFQSTIQKRIEETDAFYTKISPKNLSPEERSIERQANAGMLWSKQFYHYSVKDWMKGDPNYPKPPEARKQGRNKDWKHLFNRDIISMPDKWEYPWYAAWDLAFHTIPFARLDPHFAKRQLILMLREWYMHPNGQIPAYEFEFSDVNPPVHAWACWRIYKMTGAKGTRDIAFLTEAFHKLLLNFTWWINRKDPDGKNLFAGGFLGLDNIGAFDRSKPLPGGGYREQADGTAWMAFYCSTMLSIALELAHHNPAYDGVASKFFEHFMAITEAINTLGGHGLWDDEDGFYYDQINCYNTTFPVKIRSLVGLIPILATEVLEESLIDNLPAFKRRTQWFMKYRQDISAHIAMMQCHHAGEDKMLLAIPSREKLERVLSYVLNEDEFLSPYGIRSLSKYHKKHPFVVEVEGDRQAVHYTPGESDSFLFGGNSNWRGPIWFPLNFLFLEALEKYHYFYGDTFKVECPTGSGNMMTLNRVAEYIGRRMINLFTPGETGMRPAHGNDTIYKTDPHFKDLVLFYEYFHGDTGKGLGASHQTGWTGLIAKYIEELGKRRPFRDGSNK
ncbi:MAG: glucosidase [Opitutales bacterium]